MADGVLLKHVDHDVAGIARWSIEVRPGQSIGVSGPSGVGKTTVIRAIARANLGEASPVRIAYLPQNPRDLFPAHLTAMALAETWAGEQADPARFWTRCRAFLAQLGLDAGAILHATSASLSGGEVQRVAIAILLATEPDLLLADEPTASLDARATDAVTTLFAAQRASRALALLVTSHDAAFLAAACDQLYELGDGALLPRPPGQITTPSMSRATPSAPLPLLDIAIRRHVLAATRGGAPRILLPAFTAVIGRGVVYGLAGPSGVGKSTLLRFMAGHERPTHGRVRRVERNPSRPFAILTPQDPKQFFDPQRSMEAHARLLAKALKRQPAFGDLAEVLDRLELRDGAILSRRAGAVSGGEAQRLTLAITLWLEPQLMCLDEIDTGVPSSLKQTMGRMVRDQVTAHNGAAVLVSHDLDFLSTNCDEIIRLEA